MRKLLLAALGALAPSCALASAPVYGPLQAQNALSELGPMAAQARMNLGLGSAATMSASAFDAAGAASTAQAASLQKSSNLSDLTNAATARTNLGLGSAATQPTSAFDAAGAASTAQAASLQKSSNLSDLSSLSTARTNLGLGTAATSNTSAFDAAGTAASTLSAAIGTTVAPLPLPASDLPPATSSVQGAMSLVTAGAQAPVQSVAGLTGAPSAAALSSALGKIPSLTGYGAACNGTTNDSTALTAAIAAALPFSLPAGVCNAPSISWTAIPGVAYGPGQIKTSDGNKRGPILSERNSPPTAFGNFSEPGTAWNGDLSGVGFAHEHIVTGATTLGQPTTGYQQNPEDSAEVETTYNSSGYNASLSGNSGRTGLSARYIDLYQYGQGDLSGIGCFGIVASTLTGATSYLASPAVECMGGALYGSAAGQYIEYLGDMDVKDNGYDIAGAGTVMNFSRSVATEGIGANWIADLRQSLGIAPLDAFYRASGPAVVGLDLANVALGDYRLAAYTLNSGGAGYVVGDTLTVSGGTAITPTTFAVTAVSSGVITALSLSSPGNTGIYSAPPVTTYSGLTVTGGTGSGASVSGFYDGDDAMLLPPAGGCLKPSSTGSSTTELGGYTASLCINSGSLVYGLLNSMPVTGNTSVNVVLGPSNTLLGHNNVVLGTESYDEASIGALYWSGGTFSGSGAGQEETSWRTLYGSSTGAFRLTTTAGAASGQDTYIVANNSSHAVSFRVTMRDETNGDTAVWKWRNGLLSRPAGGTASYVGDASSATAPDYSTGAGSTASLTVSADTTLESLNITVTPPSGTGHTWHAMAKLDADQLE